MPASGPSPQLDRLPGPRAGYRTIVRRRQVALLWAAAGLLAAGGLPVWSTGFTGHVVAHLLLGMLGPLVLVLGDPFGLVLPALGPPGRRRVLRVAHAPLVRMLSLPPVAWALAVLTPWALWLTPIYAASERHDVVHLLVHAHVIVAGTVFASVVLGVGPLGRRTSPAAGLLMIALSLPAHALLGLVVLSMDQPLLDGAGDRAVALADQRTGALILWVGGDLVATAMLAAAFPRWLRAEQRHARREDAAVDALADAAQVRKM